MRRTGLKNRGNKFGAKKQKYNGFSYDSGFEAECAQKLDLILAANEIKDWDRQYSIDLNYYDSQGNLRFSKKHKVDFRVHELNGTFTLLEAKGFETPDWREKKRMIEKVWLLDHPDYQYKVVKKGDNWRRFAGD